jgi:hypothetical protein
MDPSDQSAVVYTNKLKGNRNSSGNRTSSGNSNSRYFENNFKEIATIKNPSSSRANPKPSSGGYKKTRRNRRRSAKSRSRKH